jgi:enhancing lycopene biosynthesis protein 2
MLFSSPLFAGIIVAVVIIFLLIIFNAIKKKEDREKAESILAFNDLLDKLKGGAKTAVDANVVMTKVFTQAPSIFELVGIQPVYDEQLCSFAFKFAVTSRPMTVLVLTVIGGYHVEQAGVILQDYQTMVTPREIATELGYVLVSQVSWAKETLHK